jgi:site-specific DNA-methyltransferase (adenine-specific)
MTTESTKETTIIHGDCLEKLKELPDNSVDAIVTDPPYGLSFMGKKWDYDVPSQEIWVECLRVLKHGGHLLAFAGTRTQHRMAVRIEDAGFEIRDMIAWVYGSGFPKSLDVSKAIDKAAGAEREVIGEIVRGDVQKAKTSGVTMAAADANKNNESIWGYGVEKITAPATEAAKQWQGWGTALKPALEPITVARKPLIGTVAANVLAHGTGALNIDGCRVSSQESTVRVVSRAFGSLHDGREKQGGEAGTYGSDAGRWPANLIHDGNEPADLLGDAARFFYCAKASKRDRDEGLERFTDKQAAGLPMRSADGERGGEGLDGTKTDRLTVRKNFHPTVKPTDLMRYLCRLVTPPNGVVLDPFMGSGSTGKAATLEGFGFIGIEREAEYVEIAKARIGAAANETHTGDLFA